MLTFSSLSSSQVGFIPSLYTGHGVKDGFFNMVTKTLLDPELFTLLEESVD